MAKALHDALFGRKAKTSPSPPARHEWLFRQSEVPDGEIVACACWEYLREVPHANLGPTGYAGYARKMIFAYRSVDARRKFNDSFDHIPLNVLLHLARNPDVTTELQPWQDLDRNLRREINKPMPKAWRPLIEMEVIPNDLIAWNLQMPDPGQFASPRPWAEVELEVYVFACADLARRKLAEEQQRSSNVRPLDPPSEEHPKPRLSINDFSPHDPRSWLISYASNGLASPAPFLINWGEYDNHEIVAAFSDWIRTARPRFAPEPRGKGTKTSSLRFALRDLGALRVLNTMPSDTFIREHDSDYLLFQQPWKREKAKKKLPTVNLEKLRRQAIKFFQAHFATDPSTKPRAWRKPRTEKQTLVAPSGDLPDF